MFWWTILPILLFVVLVLRGKMKLVDVALLCLITTVAIVIVCWRMKWGMLGASLIKGGLVATDILLIIIGALFFLTIVEQEKVIDQIIVYLEHISGDYRVQVIVLAWFLENFLEGTAGFGTPSTVAAPLLVSIGIPPLSAVIVALLGNSTAVAFGAAGTPIRVGLAGLETSGIPFLTAAINNVGCLVPVFMLWVVTGIKGKRKEDFVEALPLALLSGVFFTVPATFLALIGQEFPSIIGSVIGLVLMLISLKFVGPKEIKRLKEKVKIGEEKMSILKVFSPYLILMGLLIGGKFWLAKINWTINFGLNHSFSLFNPGLIFLITTLVVLCFWKSKKIKVKESMVDSIKKSIEPFLTIALVSAMVQIMINSGNNYSGNKPWLQVMSEGLATPWLPLITPIVGAFGSFLTGSATLSNIMFGSILQSTATKIGMWTILILALQTVGAAAGNMISLADILPAMTVLKVKGKVKEVIKGVIIPCLVYVLLTGVIGMMMARG